MKKWFAAVALTLATVAAQAAPLVEGKDFTRVANPTPVGTPGKVEVREFFWYGCPHCFALEPSLAAWVKSKPAGVDFIRTPAALNPVWEANARGYYVAEASGALEKTHQALFDAIHVGKQSLYDQASLAKFYAGYGITPANFNGLYQSFSVSAKVAQARNLAIRYQLTGVPTLVVNGKYLVSGDGPHAIEVVKELVSRERASR